MGGTIALLASREGGGHTVTLLDMTDGEPTPFGDPVTRAREAAEAAKRLSPADGGNPVRRIQLGLKNREVVHSLEARHKVAGVIRATQAQVLFVPYFEDAHPDHLAVTRIAEDARFDAKLTRVKMPGDDGKPPLYPKWLFHYYATHLRIVPSPSFIVDVSRFAAIKRSAILAYESQFVKNEGNRRVVEWVEQQGGYFGSRIGVEAGEPFFSREPVGLLSLGSLVI